jgi:hypothetical protein
MTLSQRWRAPNKAEGRAALPLWWPEAAQDLNSTGTLECLAGYLSVTRKRHSIYAAKKELQEIESTGD